MDEINKLTSIIVEMKETITSLTKERDRYEKQCYLYSDELEVKKKMLDDIEKIVFRKKKSKVNL